MSDYRYKQTWHGHPVGSEPKHWSHANGEDIIKSFIAKRGFYEEPHSIERNFAKLIEAVGRIADRANINLLEVFQEDELDDLFKLNDE